MSKKEKEKAQINVLTSHLNELEKEQRKPKVSRRKEIITIRAEINDTESLKMIPKSNDTKSLFFGKINKIDKPLPDLSSKKEKGPK